jgi:hypothetical protein
MTSFHLRNTGTQYIDPASSPPSVLDDKSTLFLDETSFSLLNVKPVDKLIAVTTVEQATSFALEKLCPQRRSISNTRCASLVVSYILEFCRDVDVFI